MFNLVNYDLVELLLKSNAKVNVKDVDGSTPLHLAVINGDRDIVQLLVENGAKIMVKDNDNQTPYDYAITYGKVIGKFHGISNKKLQFFNFQKCRSWWDHRFIEEKWQSEKSGQFKESALNCIVIIQFIWNNYTNEQKNKKTKNN